SRQLRRQTEGLQGMTLEPLSLLATELFRDLLHQADGLDGLRLGGIHVAGLASSLSLADQFRRVGAATLRASQRPRRLHILRAAARSLDVLRAATRGLYILGAAATSLHAVRLVATRSLDVLRAATRGLHILGAAATSLHAVRLVATRSLDVLRAAARR